jgi:hypothetical protein
MTNADLAKYRFNEGPAALWIRSGGTVPLRDPASREVIGDYSFLLTYTYVDATAGKKEYISQGAYTLSAGQITTTSSSSGSGGSITGGNGDYTDAGGYVTSASVTDGWAFTFHLCKGKETASGSAAVDMFKAILSG